MPKTCNNANYTVPKIKVPCKYQQIVFVTMQHVTALEKHLLKKNVENRGVTKDDEIARSVK